MSTTSLLWHYTIGQDYRRIVAAKLLKPSAAYSGTDQWPVVWFSRNQVWESSSTKILTNPDGTEQVLTLEELDAVGGGLFRFGVAKETAPYGWDEFVKKSGMPREIAAGLRRLAKEKGSNIKYWFASFDAVDQTKWLAIEVSENHKWIDVKKSKLNFGGSFDVCFQAPG